ncbi:hypothetical protein DFH09DRAFT_1393583 [Mycena vulgaris]|nr:hypothetical protein DFH09DRAFT_1464775 [Mycena vulgaris]KAJ6541159.1 hypothetical protein DFH09DRAFT_1393583 [Mycena vulgaris]
MLTLVHFVIFLFSATTVRAKNPLVFNDLACRFSLSAWNMTFPGVNSTGLPLVLGENGANDGPTSEITSTYASYPSNVYPTLSLSNGSIRAYRASGAWLTNATAVASGDLLSWYTSPLFDRDAARIYTAVQSPGTGPFHALAAYGVDDQWSLCPLNDTLGQTSVVFNISADMGVANLRFDPRQCWKVRILLMPVGSREFLLFG